MESRLKKSRKGIFLTFISLSLIAAFILIFTPTTVTVLLDKGVVKTRIVNLNNFVLDLENVYFQRVFQSSGTKAAISLINYMEDQNEFISSFESSFIEVIQNGTIEGAPIDSITGQTIMGGHTLSDWIERVINVSDEDFNTELLIDVRALSVYQTEPWHLTVEGNLSLQVISETALWNKNVTILSSVPIHWFTDPYYSVNTQGTIQQRINKTTVKTVEWNIGNVSTHIEFGTYAHFENSQAPSFITRFMNGSDASLCCGIESLVDPNDLTQKDQMESYADYRFFSHRFQGNCTNLYNITGLYSSYRHLKLDIDHLFLYNISSDDYVRSC